MASESARNYLNKLRTNNYNHDLPKRSFSESETIKFDPRSGTRLVVGQDSNIIDNNNNNNNNNIGNGDREVGREYTPSTITGATNSENINASTSVLDHNNGGGLSSDYSTLTTNTPLSPSTPPPPHANTSIPVHPAPLLTQQQQQQQQLNQIAPASDQYLPGLDFSVLSNPQSPTLGLSETEWKSIPFTTRLKLKAAAKSGTNSDTNTRPNSFEQDPFDEAASSVNSSLGRTSSLFTSTKPNPIPFSARQRQRASSMYNNISSSPLSNSSPAYQFLSRIGNPMTDTTSSENPLNITTSENELGEQVVGDYVIGKMIGYGGFSQVKEAHIIENGNKIVRAVKIVPKYNRSSSREVMEKIRNEFDHEVNIWKTLNHPNILKLRLVIEDSKATYCFADRITGGTLFDVVKSTRGDLDHNLAKLYIYHLSSALLYLHTIMRIVHRDVKLENCLVEHLPDGKSKVVLCDFGLSDYYGLDEMGECDCQYLPLIGPSANACTMISHLHQKNDDFEDRRAHHSHQHHHVRHKSSDESTSSSLSRMRPLTSLNSSSASLASMTSSTSSTASDENFGSLPYACPQLLTSSVPIIDPTVDIWSFGVVLYALYMGKLPWHHSFLPKLRMMILQGHWDRQLVK